jgi:hypothetical protein
MFEIFILLVVFIVGFLVGEFSVLFRMHKVVISMIDSESDKSDKKEETELHKLFVEDVDDVLYLYNDGDRAFICQAKTMDELAKLSQEYKNIKYAAVVHDNKVFAFVDGIVKNV